MRAITHLHTRFSWDCQIAPEKLLLWLAATRIELALISDHDSFEGSLACRRLAGERALPVQIPVAAEVRTDRGDVIVIFDDESGGLPEIEELKAWESLRQVVRERGGLIWLPHPYQSHNHIEELAEGADVVEVFNARCSEEQNRQGALLCDRHQRVPGYGADVHRRRELGGCVVDYVDRGATTESLRGPPTPIVTTRSKKSDIMAAEVTHGLKQRHPATAAYFGMRWVQHRRREASGVRA